MREEELWVARGAKVEALDPGDARLPKRSLGGLPEIELAPAHDLGTEASAVRACDLFADLVTARADRRPDRRRHGAAERRYARLDNAVEEPDPPGVKDTNRGRGAVPASERDRQAVGAKREHRQPRLAGPQPLAPS